MYTLLLDTQDKTWDHYQPVFAGRWPLTKVYIALGFLPPQFPDSVLHFTVLLVFISPSRDSFLNRAQGQEKYSSVYVGAP